MPRPVEQVSRTVARNSAAGFAAQFVIRALSFAFSVLIVRHLGADTFGQYSAVLAYGAVFVFLADLGLSPYSVREIARWRDAPDGLATVDRFYGNVLLLRFLLSVLTATLLIVSAYLTGRPLVMVGAIALGTLGLVMYSVEGTNESVLAGFERLYVVSGSRVVQQIAFVVVGAVALYVGLGYYGLIVANLLGIAVLTVLCWRGVRRLGVRPSGALLRSWPQLLRSSLPFGIIGFTLGLSYKFDSVLLNIFRGDAETGYYNAAYNLIFSAVVLSNVFNTTLYPSLSRHAAHAPESLTAIYGRALRYLLVLSLPITLGTWVLADQLVPLLYTPSYAPAVPALRILVWVTPFMFASEFLGYIVVIQGNETRVAQAVLASTGLNVALNLILVPHFGLLGASVMTVATEVVLVGQYVWTLRDLLTQIELSRAVARPIVAALLMGAIVYLARGFPLPVTIVVGAGVYAGLLLAMGVLGKDELTFLRSLRGPPTGPLVAGAVSATQ